jgi:uncharacterized protein DUF6484
VSQRVPLGMAEGSLAAFHAGVVVGRLDASSMPGALYVDYAGNGRGPLPARTTLPLSAQVIDAAARTAQGALLVFENGDPTLPIVVGLLQQPAVSPLAELLAASPEAPAGPVEARLDGERVVLEARREIVLKCGAASLTLRRDGKVLIRGAYVETHSRGVNRIKGGSVKIN